MQNDKSVLTDDEDEDLELDDIDFPVVDDIKASFVDNRDYVDRCFKSFTLDRGLSPRSVRKIVCDSNDEPIIGKNEVAVLLNYKMERGKGRRSFLAGFNVLHISTPMGPLRIPLDQAEKFGKYLIGAARSAMKSVDNQTNDNVEK